MSEISNYVFENFNVIFAFAAIWVLLFFSWQLWQRKRRGLFEDGKPPDVIFEENTASGRSHKNWYSKIGGASNCLKVVVTSTELWVTPRFPFSALADIFDLDHRIDLKQITSVVPKTNLGRKSYLVHFIGARGGEETIELAPKNPEQFHDAVLGNRSTAT